MNCNPKSRFLQDLANGGVLRMLTKVDPSTWEGPFLPGCDVRGEPAEEDAVLLPEKRVSTDAKSFNQD